MKRYIIQQRIKTVAANWLNENNTHAHFEASGITLTQHSTYQHGPTEDYWIASKEVTANSVNEVCRIFWPQLRKLVARISVISQGYIQFNNEPCLVSCPEISFNCGFLWYTETQHHVGLTFYHQEKISLDELMDSILPDEFFYYWQDATNTTGYSAKLLLMFAAIESLERTRTRKLYPKLHDIKKRILGEELFSLIYGEKGDSQKGLRNRLAHGEYLEKEDDTQNYVAEVHKKIIIYLNETTLTKSSLQVEVEDPQRNFNDNVGHLHPMFIKRKDVSNQEPLSLTDVMKKFSLHEENLIYDWASRTEQDELWKTFPVVNPISS